MNRTYECAICWNINSAVKLHCSCCGTIPAHYSITGKPARIPADDAMSLDVLVAYGCERQVSRKTIKRHARTVSLTYYAQE